MKNIIQLFIYILCVICTTFLLLTNSVYAAVNVVTTTTDAASISKSIGGSYVNVISLTKGTRDPHFATAKPSMIKTVSRADLLIVIGAELEVGWLPALLQSGRNANVTPGNEGYLDLSTAVNIKGRPTAQVTRDMGDVHSLGNPHYWLDPENGILMAKAIANRLSEIDSKHKEVYQKNAFLFEKKIHEKQIIWIKEMDFLRNKPVITYHTSMLYLAKTFGFNIVENIEPKPGISPSARHLNRLIETIKQNNVQLILVEPYYEIRSAELLKRKTGINIAVIPQSVGAQSNVTNYFELFDEITKTIKLSVK